MSEKLSRGNMSGQGGACLLVFQEGTEEVYEKELVEHTEVLSA